MDAASVSVTSRLILLLVLSKVYIPHDASIASALAGSALIRSTVCRDELCRLRYGAGTLSLVSRLRTASYWSRR